MIKIAPKNVFILLLSLIMFPTLLTAQEEPAPNENATTEKAGKAELIISGTMYNDGLRMENVILTLKDDGAVISESYSDQNGKFKVTMKLDKILTLHFSMDEYVEKIVEIDTRNVPNDNRKYDFTYKGWRVDMFSSALEVDYSSLKKPVAIVVYNPAEDGFSTDKKYERSVRPSRERLIKAVYDALDQKEMDSEDAFDDYMLAVKDGDLYLKEGDYESALMQYEAAKEILPKESYPGKQIQKTMALMQANSSIDEQYASHLTTADAAFDNKEWATAQISYEFAHDVKPKIEYPMDQMDVIRKKIADEKLLLVQMKEKEKQATYDAFVVSADSLMALAKYSESKTKYRSALAVYSKKQYPKTKINEIDLLISNNEKAEKAYASLLANANSFLNNKEYDKAKESYSQALGIRPEDELPKSKLLEIDALLGGLAALKAKELEMTAQKEAALQAKYDGLILSADALMVDKSYDKAKADYEGAVLLKSKEVYPQNQIRLINSTLAELEGVDKQFDKLMANALKNQNAKKLELAKSDYQAALSLKPNEQAPQDAITKIDGLLAASLAATVAKQKAIDDKYDGFVADGDAMMAIEKYTDAETAYNQALTVKSKEEYPKTQISIIHDKLGVLAAATAASEKEAKELALKEQKYNALIVKADQQLKTGSYAIAKSTYEEALVVFTGKAYPMSQISDIDSKLALLAADEAATAKAAEELKAKEGEYQSILVKADAAFTAKDFVKARLEYQNAQKVFADKPYPANQIKKISGLELAAKQKVEQEALLLAQQAENKAKFDATVTEGDNLVAKGEFQKAKYKYEASLKLIAGDPVVIKKMRDVTAKLESERKLAEFHAKNDTEYNKQLAVDYPNGLNETKKAGGKTTTRIVVVGNGRGDEFKKEVYSYGAVFYFKNGKKIDENTYKRETKGH